MNDDRYITSHYENNLIMCSSFSSNVYALHSYEMSIASIIIAFENTNPCALSIVLWNIASTGN